MVTFGNVSILKKRLEDQKITVELDNKTLGDEIEFDEYDFIFIGSGTEKNLDVILNDIKKYKEELEKYINKEKLILLTGNSFEAFGKSIDSQEGLRNF